MSRGIERLNVLAKWRTIFAGWQLGTRPKGDPEADAVRDHREATLIMRAEVSALAAILIKKGVCTQAEWDEQVAIEADAYNEMLSRRFPGAVAFDGGMKIDQRAAEWMSKWKP